MSSSDNKTKVVKTTKTVKVAKTGDDQKRVKPTKSRYKGGLKPKGKERRLQSEFIFGKRSYMFMLLGFVLIVIGLVLMSGGRQPDPNTWEPDVIYSARRITLAPLVILIGFGVEIYAIFTRPR